MYKELKGSDTLRQMYPKINDNTKDINARVDNIIQGQDLDPNKDTEIVDARLDSTDSTTYDTLKARLDKHSTDIDSNTSRISTIENDTQNLDARTTTLEGEVFSPDYTPDIYNTSSIFSAGAGTDENGNPLNYSDSIEESQVSVGLKGETRTNLVPLFDSGKWSLHANVTVNSPTKITLNADASYQTSFVIVNVKSSTPYVMNIAPEINKQIVLRQLDSAGVVISSHVFQTIGEKVLLTTGTNTVSLKIELRNGTEVGAITFENVMIEEGTEVKPFITGTKSTCAIKQTSVGKNLFDGELESGVYSGTTGLPSDNVSYFRNKNKHIKVNPSTNYALSNDKAITDVRIYYYTINKEFISSVIGSSQQFTTPSNAQYINFRYLGTDLNTKVMLEQDTGQTLGVYEPYTESISYVEARDNDGNIVELHSVGSVEDKVSNGKLYKRVSDEYTIKESDITLVVNRTHFTTAHTIAPLNNDQAQWGDGIEGKVRVDGRSEISLTQREDSNIANTFYTVNTGRIDFIVPLGTSLADAKTLLAGTSLTYQLKNVIVTELNDITPLTAFKNGTIILEPYLRRALTYDATTGNGLDLPYSVLYIDKIEDNEGNEVDLSTVTLASDGLSATISTAADGEVYMVYAQIRPENSTIPTSVMKYVMNASANDEMQNKSIMQLSGNVLELQKQVAILMVMTS